MVIKRLFYRLRYTWIAAKMAWRFGAPQIEIIATWPTLEERQKAERVERFLNELMDKLYPRRRA